MKVALRCFMILAVWSLVSMAWAQVSSTGEIVGTVQDASGAVMVAAEIELKDDATGNMRKIATGESGNFTFPVLQPGRYTLTIRATGFDTAVYTDITVNAGRTANINAVMRIGSIQQQVTVTAPIESIALETSSNVVSNTIQTRLIEDLPLDGRDLLSLSNLMAGFQRGTSDTNSTFNGLPGGSLNFTLDGMSNVNQKWKSGGTNFSQTPVVARVETIQEVTTSTSGLSADQGGQGAMQVQFVTRRGGNEFHGRLFEQHQNGGLNANEWFNNARGLQRPKLVLNDFGGSLGGPVIKDKLFFFGSFATTRQPGSAAASRTLLTQEAQTGVFRYLGTDGVERTVNVLQIAGKAGLPIAVNSVNAAFLTTINKSRQHGTIIPQDLFREQIAWLHHSNSISYWPTVRLDYNLTPNFRLNGSWNLTYVRVYNNGVPAYPGPDYEYQSAGPRRSRFGINVGFDWTIASGVIHEFKVGKLRPLEQFSVEALNPKLEGYRRVIWPLGTESGNNTPIPITRNTPTWNLIDNTYIQTGKHSFRFGGSYMRAAFDNLNYEGFAGALTWNLGVATGDPITGILNAASMPGIRANDIPNAQNLYALLTGRVSGVTAVRHADLQTKNYKDFAPNISNQVTSSFGLYFQDSWRVSRSLTLNYGLRWEFVGTTKDPTDLSNAPGYDDFWGSSGEWNLFNPGVFRGLTNPQIYQRSQQYGNDLVNPAPNLGISWNPAGGGRLRQALLGDHKTVFRLNYGINYYQEGLQNFSQSTRLDASQSVSLTAGSAGFPPGSLTLDAPLPPMSYSPPNLAFPHPMGQSSGFSRTLYVFQRKMRTPYVQSWSVGMQRELGGNHVVEVRYVGNHAVHLWNGYNLNEVNIFENGFLKEFQNAQKNLAINSAAGVSSFANRGLSGQVPLPIFESAFGALGSNPALAAGAGFGSSAFITNLTQGAAGTLASSLAFSPTYVCRMTGSSSELCNSLGYSVAGKYPSNFFVLHPLFRGLGLMSDEASSNYHGLQIEVRRKPSRGLSLNANYSYSKSLGNRFSSAIWELNDFFTLRNKGLNDGPTQYDVRHAFRVYGTYQLPFGKGALSVGRVVDRIIGDWTIGGIGSMSSGSPFLLSGGYSTINQLDSGVMFNGVTREELQKSVGPHFVGSAPYVYTLDPKYVGPDGRANPQYLTPPGTPGQFGNFVYLYGPRYVAADFSLTKRVTLRESIRAQFQAEFLNAFNHPIFQMSNALGFLSATFARGTAITVPARRIQFRLQVDF